MDNIFVIIVIGIIAGWLASRIMGRKHGYGLFGNLIIGVLGAFIGAYLFDIVGISTSNIIGTLLMSLVGAVTLLYIIRLLKKV